MMYCIKKNCLTFWKYVYLLSSREVDQKIDATLVCMVNIKLKPAAKQNRLTRAFRSHKVTVNCFSTKTDVSNQLVALQL